jgi:accessory gene regulator B
MHIFVIPVTKNGVICMIKDISEQLTGFFIRTSVIKEEDRQNFNFCFTVIIFDLISLLALVALAIAFGRILETLIYLIAFLTLRFNAGGFHASTHLRCFMTLCCSYIMFLILLAIVPNYLYLSIGLASMMISVPTIFALAPIEHANRKFTPQEVKSFKARCRITACLWLVVISSLLVFVESASVQVLALSGSFGVFSIALSLIAAKITNKLRRNHHVESQIGSV